QIFELTVRGGKGAEASLEALPVPQHFRSSLAEGPSTNVAEAYTRFARDYREGTHLCPTFDDAVTRHRMLDAIEKAAATAQRQTTDRSSTRSAAAAKRSLERLRSRSSWL